MSTTKNEIKVLAQTFGGYESETSGAKFRNEVVVCTSCKHVEQPQTGPWASQERCERCFGLSIAPAVAEGYMFPQGTTFTS